MTAFLDSEPARLARQDQKSSVEHAKKYLVKTARRNLSRKKSCSSLLLKELLRVEDCGRWHHPLPFSAPAAPVGDESFPSDARGWEWPTAIVRRLFRYNTALFEETADAVRRGDCFFFDPRGKMIEDAARRVFSPFRLEGRTLESKPPIQKVQDEDARLCRRQDPELMAAIAEEFETLTAPMESTTTLECGTQSDRCKRTLFPDSFGTIQREPSTTIDSCVSTQMKDQPGRELRPGERDIHRLWRESWGKDVLERDDEIRRLVAENERRKAKGQRIIKRKMRIRPWREKRCDSADVKEGSADDETSLAPPSSSRVVEACLALDRAVDELRITFAGKGKNRRNLTPKAMRLLGRTASGQHAPVQLAALEVVEAVQSSHPPSIKSFLWMGQNVLTEYVMRCINFLGPVCQDVFGRDFPHLDNPFLLPITLAAVAASSEDALVTYDDVPSHWPALGAVDHRRRLQRASVAIWRESLKS